MFQARLTCFAWFLASISSALTSAMVSLFRARKIKELTIPDHTEDNKHNKDVSPCHFHGQIIQPPTNNRRQYGIGCIN